MSFGTAIAFPVVERVVKLAGCKNRHRLQQPSASALSDAPRNSPKWRARVWTAVGLLLSIGLGISHIWRVDAILFGSCAEVTLADGVMYVNLIANPVRESLDGPILGVVRLDRLVLRPWDFSFRWLSSGLGFTASLPIFWLVLLLALSPLIRRVISRNFAPSRTIARKNRASGRSITRGALWRFVVVGLVVVALTAPIAVELVTCAFVIVVLAVLFAWMILSGAEQPADVLECANCGYNLAFSPTSVCSECGLDQLDASGRGAHYLFNAAIFVLPLAAALLCALLAFSVSAVLLRTLCWEYSNLFTNGVFWAYDAAIIVPPTLAMLWLCLPLLQAARTDRRAWLRLLLYVMTLLGVAFTVWLAHGIARFD